MMISKCLNWFPFGELGEPNININLFELQGNVKVGEGVCEGYKYLHITRNNYWGW